MSNKLTGVVKSRSIAVGAGYVSLTMNGSIEERLNAKINSAQRYLDWEILRRSAPYAPYLTGRLLNSGYSSTVVGSGLVTYQTPYARKQYYNGRSPGTSLYGALRGLMWFERMKSANLPSLTSNVAAILGGETG